MNLLEYCFKRRSNAKCQIYQNLFSNFIFPVMTLALRLASTLLALSPAARNTSGTFPTASMLTPGHPEPRTPSPRAGTLRSLSASALGVFQTNWGLSSLWRDRWHYTTGPGTILSSVFWLRQELKERQSQSVCLSIFLYVLAQIFKLLSQLSLQIETKYECSPFLEIFLGDSIVSSLCLLCRSDGA